MSIEHADWLKRVKTKDTERLTASRPAHEFLARAAVTARNLTGSPEWDLYLSFGEAALERTRRQREAFRATLENPAIVDINAIVKARNDVIIADERIRVIEAMMALPKDLIAAGDKAKSLLERLDGEEAA